MSKIRVSEIRGSEIRGSEIRVSEIRVSEIRVSEIRISSNHRELHGAIFSCSCLDQITYRNQITYRIYRHPFLFAHSE